MWSESSSVKAVL